MPPVVSTQQTPSQEANELPPNDVQMAVDSEIRFAVVMYGGVSLAIYINGIAQELLSLVRATAPSTTNSPEPLLTDKKLVGAAGVYRKLGQFLTELDPKKRFEQLTAPELTKAPITTRFIVDIISG